MQQGLNWSVVVLFGLTDDIFPTSGSVGLVSRFGQFYKSVDPGLVQVNVRTESMEVVNVRTQIVPIGRQTVMYVSFPLLKIVLVSNSSFNLNVSTRDNVQVEMYRDGSLSLSCQLTDAVHF